MKAIKRELFTCYYPEYWPNGIWKSSAKKMVDTKLKGRILYNYNAMLTSTKFGNMQPAEVIRLPVD
tara:strand:- start:215 stop:412 length:198 start_codon:yes stop_codon:yes gene_type:complete